MAPKYGYKMIRDTEKTISYIFTVIIFSVILILMIDSFISSTIPSFLDFKPVVLTISTLVGFTISFIVVEAGSMLVRGVIGRLLFRRF